MEQPTPHQILKLTPRTNCGECGYPACLAFAANVAKGGEDPHKCPYLDSSSLNLDQGGATPLEEEAKKRDMALIAHLKGKVAGLDLASLAAPLAANFIGDSLEFTYLGQQTRISGSGVLINGAEPDDPRDQILLYNYLHFGGGPAPDPTWTGLESLPNSISKVRTLATYCEDKLAQAFSAKGRAQVLALCAKVGGRELTGSSATAACVVPVLPRIPQQIIFWDEEPEDGFPAKVKVLFAANVLTYLDIESLVFTAERMAEIITDQGE
ncbi:MAG: DUF3786 domain-containing protein [Thermodesulfobacteriota bacterium]